MIDGGLGSVPIIDEEKRLIGIVTQHTLLNAILSGEKIHLLEAGAIMGPARFISSDCLAFKIGPIFQETGLSSISVVDHESRLVGIITEGDLLIGYVEEALDLSPHLKK
jgi:CBS-domain-containing membrane protein